MIQETSLTICKVPRLMAWLHLKSFLSYQNLVMLRNRLLGILEKLTSQHRLDLNSNYITRKMLLAKILKQ